MNFAGIDIGRSGIKIAVKAANRPQITELDIIPSVACPAGPLHDQDEARRATEETVLLDNEPWWFGHTAQLHGRAQNPGVFSDWQSTTEYRALIRGSFKKLAAKGFEPPWRIVAGLPSESTQEQRQRVSEIIAEAAGTESKCKVIAQPAGIYFIVAATNPELRKPDVNCAVLDIGRFSTDLVIIAGGRPIGHTLRSFAGVKLAVDMLGQRLRGRVDVVPPFDRLERALVEGHLIVNTRPVDISDDVSFVKAQFANEIARNYQVLVSDTKGAIDYVLVGGGGAELVTPELSKLIQIDAPKDARRLVSRGFLYAAQHL